MAAGGAIRGAAVGTAVCAARADAQRRFGDRGPPSRREQERVARRSHAGSRAGKCPQPQGGAMNRTRALLGVPFVALMWVPLYARLRPEWLGIPFFYWYLFGWVGVTAAINAWVYSRARDPR
ncbi:MAG TPA: DUF3311 domain-containing protein [Terriglobales bacterium]|nr:DUF3311 domain-containing protein [Terriglobales bacterium]